MATLDDIDDSEEEDEPVIVHRAVAPRRQPAVALPPPPPAASPPPPRRAAEQRLKPPVRPPRAELEARAAAARVLPRGSGVLEDAAKQVRAQLCTLETCCTLRDGSLSLPRTIKDRTGYGWGYDDECPSPLSAVGECGDTSCGTHRTKLPHVRKHFEAYSVRRVAAAFGSQQELGRPLVYTSFGSGLLLFDVRMLELLVGAGWVVGRVNLIDTVYADKQASTEAQCHDDDGSDDDDDDDDDDEGLDDGHLKGKPRGPDPHAERAKQALEQFADWFPRTEVRVYPGANAYSAACVLDPELRAHVLMTCDAATKADDGDGDGDDSDEKAKTEDKPEEIRQKILKMFGQGGPDQVGSKKEGGTLEFFDVLREGGIMLGLSNLGTHEQPAGKRGKGTKNTFNISCYRLEACDPGDETCAWVDDAGAGARLKLFGEEGQNDEPPQQKEARLRAQRRRAAKAGLLVFKAVHSPGVMIRAEPDVKAKLLGHKRPDDQVVVSKLRDDGWVELAPEEEPDASEEQPAYMLVNGKSLGLGVLLEPVDPSLDA